MLSYFNTFIHLVFIGFVALFPVVNPIGTAFIVSPYFAKLTRKERVSVVKRIVLYAFLICTIALFTGHWILELFGLSVPIIQLAGGIMICKIGWEFLASDKTDTPTQTPEDNPAMNSLSGLENKIFYPITFPVTTGAGTLAVLFTLSTKVEVTDISQYLVNIGALMVSILLMCILIFLFYTNANRLINYMGSHNEKIINRLMAFLIFCVGLQIAVDGITQIAKG